MVTFLCLFFLKKVTCVFVSEKSIMSKYAPEFVCTEPYQDQKPGTSGLRKPTRRFVDNKYYTENFIQVRTDLS